METSPLGCLPFVPRPCGSNRLLLVREEAHVSGDNLNLHTPKKIHHDKIRYDGTS